MSILSLTEILIQPVGATLAVALGGVQDPPLQQSLIPFREWRENLGDSHVVPIASGLLRVVY